MMPLLGNVAEIQNFLRITKINLWSNLATREGECIFIPLKIAMWKRYKNAVGGVVHAMIQIAVDSDLSAEWTAPPRSTHVHPGDVSHALIQQGERERLRKTPSSSSTTAWWWWRSVVIQQGFAKHREI